MILSFFNYDMISNPPDPIDIVFEIIRIAATPRSNTEASSDRILKYIFHRAGKTSV